MKKTVFKTPLPDDWEVYCQKIPVDVLAMAGRTSIANLKKEYTSRYYTWLFFEERDALTGELIKRIEVDECA